MSGLRHSRADDLNTRQVNVTWSPGHVNRLVLLEVSTIFSACSEKIVEVSWRYIPSLASNHDVSNLFNFMETSSVCWQVIVAMAT